MPYIFSTPNNHHVNIIKLILFSNNKNIKIRISEINFNDQDNWVLNALRSYYQLPDSVEILPPKMTIEEDGEIIDIERYWYKKGRQVSVVLFLRGRSRKNVMETLVVSRGRITSSVISIAPFGGIIQKKGEVLWLGHSNHSYLIGIIAIRFRLCYTWFKHKRTTNWLR